MIASLPMYDRAETAAANDRLWALIRDALRAGDVAAPEALTRTGDLWDHWRDPALVLSQTCGYGVEGCAPGHYRSVLVVRADDPRDALPAFAGARLAVNDALSQSGWGAVWAHAAAAGVPLAPVGPTGAHRRSAMAVAEGRADIAAIDAVTWRLIARHDALATALRILDHTEPTPGLPWIAAAGADADRMRPALAEAVAALNAADRETLGLKGLAVIDADAYRALPVPPAPAWTA